MLYSVSRASDNAVNLSLLEANMLIPLFLSYHFTVLTSRCLTSNLSARSNMFANTEKIKAYWSQNNVGHQKLFGVYDFFASPKEVNPSL